MYWKSRRGRLKSQFSKICREGGKTVSIELQLSFSFRLTAFPAIIAFETASSPRTLCPNKNIFFNAKS
jgi:hypothetical protein